MKVIDSELEDGVRTAKFDADQLESLMMTAFELMGMPEAEAQELAKAILGAAEHQQSGYQELPNMEPRRRLG